LKIKSKFSLQESIANNGSIIQNDDKNETTIEQIVEQDEPFDFEKITQAIKSFAEEKNKNGLKQLYATLTSSKISLNDSTIIIELSNEVQKEMLSSIKQDMLDSLRLNLKNKTIQLELLVSVNETEVKAYKPADKFKQMVEKNPLLLELKKRLDLEIDY
jgi:DNA polymerase-3 subunit gamma/tau